MFRLLFSIFALIGNDKTSELERETELNPGPTRIWKFYVDQESGRMATIHSDLERNMTAGCYVSADKNILDYVKEVFPETNIIFVDKTTLENIINSCTQEKLSKQTLDDDGKEVFQIFGKFSGLFILPGTKWCGAGNIAKSENDLGSAVETDKCCRDHDRCDEYILGRGLKHGLTNDSPFTKSHCKCDNEFHSCLKNVRTWTSNAVGIIYFDFLQLKCFKKDHPVTRCKKYVRSVRKRCLEYEFDWSRKKTWQVFDAPSYKWGFTKSILHREKGDAFEYMIRRGYKDNLYELLENKIETL